LPADLAATGTSPTDLIASYVDGTDADAAALVELTNNPDVTASALSRVGFLSGDETDRTTRNEFGSGNTTPAGPTAGSSSGSEWLFARGNSGGGLPTDLTPVSTDDYWGFTVTANGSETLDLNRLKFDFVAGMANQSSDYEGVAQVFIDVDGGGFNPIGSPFSVTATDALSFGTVVEADVDLSSITGASSVEIRIALAADENNAGKGLWVQGIQLDDNVPIAYTRLLGVDFNRDDAFGSPGQSLFRSVSGSATQGDNAVAYTKTIGAHQVTVSQPDSVKFEFRGANGDGTRDIPGGDTSLSFLVSDFIASREGAIDIEISGLAEGDYRFSSWHLDTFTGSDLAFAQGVTAATPNLIEARVGGQPLATVEPTALGSAGLNTTFISDSQIPALDFTFTHDGAAPLTIQLRAVQTNGSEEYLLLNGFELFQANP
jgi:hypothetical protein